jgi:alpha-tubulin suppressor-like RCC1 family protein
MTLPILIFLLATGVQAAFNDIYPALIQSGSTGFKILGSSNTRIGERASTAGDFNGDGLADILFASIGLQKFYVIFGRPGSSAFPTINILDFVASDTTGFALTDVDMTGVGWLGASAIGDVNGDGLDDVSFGAPAVDYSGRTDGGVVYVVYGRATGISNINANTWVTSSTNGYRLYGEKAGDSFGNQVLNVGDFNDDGTNDFLVYALNGDLPNNGVDDYGVTYVIFGKGVAHATDIDMLTGFTYGTQGFRIYSAAGLSAVPGKCGDVNNDGIDDIAVTAGTGTYSGRANSGAVYILFGHSTATTFADVYLSAFVSGAAGVLIIGAAAGENLGLPALTYRAHAAAVGRGGDFNDDGLNDLVIGAQGKAYILFGRSGVTSYSDIDLAAWPNTVNKGQKFVAQDVGSFGAIRLVGSLGDFNGDGVSDIFMFNAEQSGNVGWGAVFFGHTDSTPFNDIVFETFTTGATGFRLRSSDGGSYYGIHAGNAGDLNGDGVHDLVLAATNLNVNGAASAGAVFVLYGQGPPTLAPTFVPTTHPTANPTSQPSSQPSTQPTAQPSTQPSTQPSINPDALQSILASPTYKVRNGFAFAAVGADGKAQAWGEAAYGGDASAVQSQLQSGVAAIVPSRFAFAAIKADGSVTLWGVNITVSGLDRYRSLSYAVTGLVANDAAFAGVDATTGRVIAVGSKHHGGNVLDDAYCNGYSAQLSSGVRTIAASAGAFAAIKMDSTLLCWGNKHAGADVASAVLSTLVGVKIVVATVSAFAVLLADNTVVNWGNRWTGGDSSVVASQLTEVQNLTASRSCFVAFKKSSGVVVWGYGEHGGDTSAVATALSSHVIQVTHTFTAMAALKADGTVVAWGEADAGGDASAAQANLLDIARVYGNSKAFAALTSAGGVVAWGLDLFGGSIPSEKVTALSSGVVTIANTDRAFAALKNDGSVVVWGQSGHGGEPGAAVEALLASGVHTICANDVAFSAIMTDGSVVAWGHSVSVPTAGVQFTSSSLAAGAQCA